MVFEVAHLVVQKAAGKTFRTHLKTPRTAQWLWRYGGSNGGKHCSIPRCRFRDKRADSREGDAIFGIGGFENPHPPIFVNLGAQGRAGEGGGIWEGFRVREGRRAGVHPRSRLIIAWVRSRRCRTKRSGIFGKSAEDFPGYRLRGSIPNWEQMQARAAFPFQ